MGTFMPKAVATKIYKTGQTRGADDDVIFQNRVSRTSTVLIPYDEFDKCKTAPGGKYENGYIVLVNPERYFSDQPLDKTLRLGKNMLVFYETRVEWTKYPPLDEWKPATSRTAPLGGQYVARIPATTSEGQVKIIRGFKTTTAKGAGIRVYEYATTQTIKDCRLQLELLFWSCYDIEALIDSMESPTAVREYVSKLKEEATKRGLYDTERLQEVRILDKDLHTICPLCLEPISALGFTDKVPQAEGRDVPDLTVTQVSLFHIRELRTGEFNHCPYNLGWGHHHCNVVVKDSGIEATLRWMKQVLERNGIEVS